MARCSSPPFNPTSGICKTLTYYHTCVFSQEKKIHDVEFFYGNCPVFSLCGLSSLISDVSARFWFNSDYFTDCCWTVFCWMRRYEICPHCSWSRTLRCSRSIHSWKIFLSADKYWVHLGACR